jgi:hypothetical protein
LKSRIFVRILFRMEKRPKRGRPPLPKNRIKGERIEIRAVAGEREAYEAAARAAGLERSEWIRSRLNAAAERESRKGGDRGLRSHP